MAKRVNKKLIIILLILVGIILAFFTFIGIRMATLDTSINLVMTYTPPSPIDLERIKSETQISPSSQWAATLNGKVVSNSDNTHVQPSASTIKMLTALAVINQKPLNPGDHGETITIDQNYYNLYSYYSSINGSTVRVQIGESISEYDALSAMLIASANNMADTLAIWAFGSMDAYREYATNLLNQYGITNTTIGTDASGFNPSSTSTPEDLSIIAAKLLENPVLSEIVSKSSATIPVAGTIENTNKLLGTNNIAGVKTGFIGSLSGYCLSTGYFTNANDVITATVMNSPTRTQSFSDSDSLIKTLQSVLTPTELVTSGEEIGYLESWWTGKVPLRTTESVSTILVSPLSAKLSPETTSVQAESRKILKTNLILSSTTTDQSFTVPVESIPYPDSPTFFERFLKVFGIDPSHPESSDITTQNTESDPPSENQAEDTQSSEDNVASEETNTPEAQPTAPATPGNCTINWGPLTLINYHFTVDNNYIANRQNQLINLTSTYGINELNSYNGTPRLDAEAAVHLNDMIKAYEASHPGHEMKTVSCFRSVGTSCGRLCAATGTSEHHTGYACDLIDPSYGTSLDSNTLPNHLEWQWLKENSYKYGFIDRYPEQWAGGSMAQPINVDENGTTGYYETWHYRYVGIPAATDIATGKYNGGNYDSLEHYLKATNRLKSLTSGSCV